MNNYDITKTTTHSSCLQDEDKGNVNDKQQKKFRQFCVTIQTFFKSMSDKLSDLLYRFIDLFSRNVTTKTPENHTQEESITSFQQTEQTEQTASEELLTKKDLPLERNIDQEIPTRITVTPTSDPAPISYPISDSDPTPISISDKTKKDINYKVSKFFNEILDIHDDTIISSSSRAYCNIHKSIINSRENEAIIQTKEFQDTLFKENNEQLHQAINKFINELIRFTAIIWNDERKRIVAEQTSDGDNISDDCTLPQPTFISNLYYALKKKEEVVETEQITPDTEKEASAKPVVVVPAQNKEPQPTSNEYVRSKEQTKRAAENLLALNGIDRSQIYQLIKTNQISDVTLKLISRGGNILYKIDEIRERADKLPRLRPYAFNVA